MEKKLGFRPNPQPKLMNQVKEVLRYHPYAIEPRKPIASGYVSDQVCNRL